MKDLINQNFSFIKKYSPILPSSLIAKSLNINEDEIIKLDANENTGGLPKEIQDNLQQFQLFHQYPDPNQTNIRQMIAEYVDVEAKNIIVGTGADEILDLIFRLFLNQNERVLTFSPTFSYLEHLMQLNHCELIQVKRNENFEINRKAFEKIKENYKIIYLCSPNNPTGNIMTLEELNYFLSFKDKLIILDEAYIEFAEKSYHYLIKQHHNLIVLRTFSKCFAMAGIRIGYGIMNQEIQNYLMQIKPPFSISTLSEFLVKQCLEYQHIFKKQIEIIKEQREFLYNELKQLHEIIVFPSQANFILIEFKNLNASQTFEKLRNKGILTRYNSSPILKNNLRITIGQPHENKRFLKELRLIVKQS